MDATEISRYFYWILKTAWKISHINYNSSIFNTETTSPVLTTLLWIAGQLEKRYQPSLLITLRWNRPPASALALLTSANSWGHGNRVSAKFSVYKYLVTWSYTDLKHQIPTQENISNPLSFNSINYLTEVHSLNYFGAKSAIKHLSMHTDKLLCTSEACTLNWTHLNWVSHFRAEEWDFLPFYFHLSVVLNKKHLIQSPLIVSYQVCKHFSFKEAKC